MGVRQPRSMMNADADEPPAGSARPMRVGGEGRPGVGRPMSIDVVCQPHSSLMGADIAKPMPTPGQPSVIDVVHPPSMGAGVVGTMPAHVAYLPSSQSSIGVDVASDIPRPTLADVSCQPPTWTGPKPAYVVSMLRCVREYKCIRQLRLFTAQSLLLLGRRTVSPQSSPHSSVHEWLHTSETAAPPPSPAESVSSSSSELQQVFASRAGTATVVPPPLVRRECHVHLGVV